MIVLKGEQFQARGRADAGRESGQAVEEILTGPGRLLGPLGHPIFKPVADGALMSCKASLEALTVELPISEAVPLGEDQAKPEAELMADVSILTPLSSMRPKSRMRWARQNWRSPSKKA